MSLFCLMWIPLGYIVRRIIVPETRSSIWALPLGCIAAVFPHFAGPLTAPGGFGFFRWMSGFVDVVSLPALIPFAVCTAFMTFKLIPAGADHVSFSLLWLIPVAMVHSSRWNSPPSLVSMVLVPVLWTALAFGVPFLVYYIQRIFRAYVRIFAAVTAIALPFIAAASWRAFFAQRPFQGFILLAVTMVPMVISMTLDLKRSCPAVSEPAEPEMADSEQEPV